MASNFKQGAPVTPEEKRAKHAAYMREYSARNRERDAEKKREYQAAYRTENKQKMTEYHRARYAEKRDEYIARSKAAYLANPEAKKAYAAARQKELSPEKLAEYRANAKPETIAKRRAKAKERYEAKKEELNAKVRDWHYRNREKRLAQKRLWAAANRALGAHYAAKRRAVLLRATPAWADESATQREYLSAYLRTLLTGEPCEVDHIVPLDSPLVCGLHCPANLRVVPRLVNRSKGNRTWPDMP